MMMTADDGCFVQTCALVSLLTGACVPTHVAMTGEVSSASLSLSLSFHALTPRRTKITLRGRITAVGGIKEKVLGAHRAHVRTVVLPWANRTDVEQDVPHEVKRAMRFAYVRTVEEALDAAFGRGVLTWRIDGPSTAAAVLVESRL
jgi:ATP-dependent Lon protease